jgi:hypothetical protein
MWSSCVAEKPVLIAKCERSNSDSYPYVWSRNA